MTKVIVVDKQISLEKKTDIIIDKNGLIRFTPLNDYITSLEFMKKLPDFVINNKSVKEWFQYKNTSLWWFSHTRISAQVIHYFLFIDQFENMLDGLKPEIVEIRGLYENFDLIFQICKKKNVSLSIPFLSKIRILSMNFRKKIRELIVKTNIISQYKKRKRISIAKKTHHKISDYYSNCIIYVAHEKYRRSIYDFKSRKIFRGEYLVHGVLEIIRKKMPLLCIDVDGTAKGDFNSLKERLLDENQYWIPLELLYTNELELQCKRYIKEIKNNVRNLLKTKEFRKKFEYNGITFWNMVSYYFETLLSDAYLPSFIRNIEAARNLLMKLHPKSILLPYERGPYALAFIVSANELGMDCVGIQHGVIGKQHQDYGFQSVANSELGFPLPNKMILFGEYYKEILVNTLGYPLEKIIVVGHPVYDCIELSEDTNKDAIFNTLGLNPKKKTILVGTSMYQKAHGFPDYDVLMVKKIVEKFSDKPNFQIIIKPHPGDNIEIYKKIKNESKSSNLIITHTPIQQLLLLCDVYVTVMSTTLMEALVLGKPLILVKISDNLDYLSIAKTGSALEAKLDELEEKILKVVNDKELVRKLNDNGSKLVNYHFSYPTKGINEKIANILYDES